jgi:thioredoxin reductase
MGPAAEPRHLVVVGGGPAGLMCAITAARGLPFDALEGFRVLVLERGRIGQFARHGKLRLTAAWHWKGGPLVASLEAEARGAGVELREHTPVRSLDLSDEVPVVRTDTESIPAATVALSMGFFPHADLLEHGRLVHPVFSPAELEARLLPVGDGEPTLLLGRGRSTVALALALRDLRPDAPLHVVLEDPAPDTADLDAADVPVHRGGLRVLGVAKEMAVLELTDVAGRRVERALARKVLVDYNAYTTEAPTTGFLDGTPIQRRDGYVVVDEAGRTSVPGVYAAGNLVTPVSGVLTALASGFVAGLAIHRDLVARRDGRAPNQFPWLPRQGHDAHPLATKAR